MQTKTVWMYRMLAFLVVGSTLWFSQGCGSGSAGGSTSNTNQPPPSPQFLWLADGGNNRVLVFDAPFSTAQNASMVLGQADFTSSIPASSATGLNGPTDA